MATQQVDNDAKKVGGYLKEKFTIGISRITDDEMSRAIIKVTSHKLKTPNDKHLARLIQASHGSFKSGRTDVPDINQWIVDELTPHTRTRNWIVVLKTLLAFHRLMIEGSQEINAAVCRNRVIFCAQQFKDLADSPEGAMQQNLIRQYACVLEERCIVHQMSGCPQRIESDEYDAFFQSSSASASLPAFEAMMGWLEHFGEVEVREAALTNFASLLAVKMMVADIKRVYVVASKRALAVVESFSELSNRDQEAWRKAYKRFAAVSSQLIRKFTEMQSANVHWGESLPSLRPVPASLLDDFQQKPDIDVQVVPLSTLLASTPPPEDRKAPTPPPVALQPTESVQDVVPLQSLTVTPPAPNVMDSLFGDPAVTPVAPVPVAKPAPASLATHSAPPPDLFAPTPTATAATVHPPAASALDLFTTGPVAPTAPTTAQSPPPNINDLFGQPSQPIQPTSAPGPSGGGFDPFGTVQPVVSPPPHQVDFFAPQAPQQQRQHQQLPLPPHGRAW